MKAFIMHLGFEFRVGIRNKTLMLMNYLFPLGGYLMFGTLLGEINPGFLTTIVPAMSLFAIMILGGLMLPASIGPPKLLTARFR